MPSKVIDYRAVAVGLQHDGHPVQAISHSQADILDWANKIRNAHDCMVKVFVTREFLLKNFKPKYKKEEPIVASKMCLICGQINCSRETHASYKGRKSELG